MVVSENRNARRQDALAREDRRVIHQEAAEQSGRVADAVRVVAALRVEQQSRGFDGGRGQDDHAGRRLALAPGLDPRDAACETRARVNQDLARDGRVAEREPARRERVVDGDRGGRAQPCGR